MKILLVNPPVNRLCQVAQNYFPLGLGYLAAITNRMGYETRIYNAEMETTQLPYPTNRLRIQNHHLFVEALQNDVHPVWQEYRQNLKLFKPKVVGFSCTSASIMPCLKMAADAKKLCGAITVFGGMHPTILPEETAKNKAVDYIVVGEAEKSFPELVSSLAQGSDSFLVPGVGCLSNGKFSLNAPEPFDCQLENYLFPDRECVFQKDIHQPYFQAIISSRGCPYQCTFCSGRKMHGGRVRYRPAADVIEEIEFLVRNYGVKHISFYDDALVLNNKRIVELCETLLEQQLGITWGGFTRADSVDKGILSLMKASGCTYLACGVESGSDYILKKIKKGYTRSQAIEGIQLIKSAGIATAINIIVGFPFEREQDIKDSITLIKQLQVPTNVNTFTPYPGSELFAECQRLGVIEHSVDWATISQHSGYNNFVHEISPDLYKRLLSDIVMVSDNITEKAIRRNTSKGAILFQELKGLWERENHHPMRFLKAIFQKSFNKIAREITHTED